MNEPAAEAPARSGARPHGGQTALARPIARVLPLLSPAHLDRDFDYLVPPELDELAQPGVRVRVRFAGRLVDGYLLARLERTDHAGKLIELDRVVSGERVLTPEILALATAVAARYAGTRADVLRLAIPPRHARTETGTPKKSTVPARDDSNTTETVERDVSSTSDAARGYSEEGRSTSTVEEVLPPSNSDSIAPLSFSAASDGAITRLPSSRAEAGEDEAVLALPDTSTARPEPPGDRAAAGVDRPVFDSRSGSVDASVATTPEASASPGLPVDTARWERYIHGGAYVTALRQRREARAAWQALPGEDWPRRLAELAAVVAGQGRGAILLVPDQRDLDRVLAECVRLVGDSAVGLSAGLGPAARYRRWLAALRGAARVVVGTRSAVFAPVANLGLIAIWDDGDDTYAEPRAPYPHAREVAMLRAHDTGAAFVVAGFARTAEIQAVVDAGWAHDLVADRAVLRTASPRISAPGDSDIALERDPIAHAVRIPGVAFAAARSALKEGAAVLVQVPRRGYVPALACAKCRTSARCRHCHGPLAVPDGPVAASVGAAAARSPSCRWCGVTEAAFRCATCGSRVLRAMVIGAARTAEELGRAFPGVPIRGSGGGAMLDSVEPGPQVVVATVGAEPVVSGGYGVALLLDGWALLGRADLRAAEDALRRWMAAAALVRPHGQVVVMAEPSIPTVQALVRWDPVGAARAELAARAEVGFPPAVRLAAIDGTADAVAELLDAADLPEGVDQLGPVPIPDGARKPFSSGDSPAEVERMLLRVERGRGAALARALVAAQAIRSTHRSDAPLRVQIDPVDIG